MKMSRRDFVIASIWASMGPRVQAAGGPSIVFPSAPRDRLAVASYPFRGFIDTPSNNRARDPQVTRMNIKEFPALVAERFQIRNVELLGQHIRAGEPALVEELRAAVRAAGSHVVNIPTSVGGSLYDPDAARRATTAANAKKWIDTAVALDCPSVRVHIQGVKGTPRDAAVAAESLASVAEYGASKNVMVNLENDDITTEDAFFLAKVIDQVNSPWLRALPDFCNSMLKGDEAFNYDAVKEMFRRAYNISHVKDVEIDHGKTFRVDMERTFAIAKASEYKGYFSMEFEGEGDPYAGTQKLIDQSLQYLR
ncbi:MAG TPA: sugar phosphate isomerase/epimerase family protein [Bryobacteraceae bacterium]|nr:sugar phosphate isomerase/epimerase family protein [Bryobacteraceae bacterium]